MNNSNRDQIERWLKHMYKDSFRLFDPDGKPTRLLVIPSCLGVSKEKRIAVASGITNLSPGIDVLREDRKEFELKGQLYNIDHYDVYENLSECRYISLNTVLSKKESSTIVLIKKIKGSKYLNHKPSKETVDHLTNAELGG
ncbi:MAG: hypothetical protein RLZZ148_2337 [Cyanobacteriota bacterium]|jgi:hypothetical protein